MMHVWQIVFDRTTNSGSEWGVEKDLRRLVITPWVDLDKIARSQYVEHEDGTTSSYVRIKTASYLGEAETWNQTYSHDEHRAGLCAPPGHPANEKALRVAAGAHAQANEER